MTNDLAVLPGGGGLTIDNKGKSLFFSDEELRVVGCRNCVWKESGSCPRGLVGDECLPEGFCDELARFVVGLADSGDIVSAVWEKFHIYKARLQEASDYKDYLRLKEKLKSAKSDMSVSGEDLHKLELEESSARLWWARLNDHVIKSLAKVSDRNVKTRVEGKPLSGIGSARVVNFNTIVQKGEKDVKEVEDKNSNG